MADFGISEILGLAGTVASTAVGVASSISQGQAQAAQAQYQAEVAANNAKIAGYNASLASQKGAADQAAKGAEERARLGAEAAMEGAEGVEINSGSAVDTKASTRATALNDLGTVSRNSALDAYGYQNQSRGYTSQSEADKTAASNAESSILPNALGEAFKGASSFADKWNKYSTNG